MTLQEVIEIQGKIIEMQSQLNQDMAAALNVDLAYNEEARHIEELKKKLEV